MTVFVRMYHPLIGATTAHPRQIPQQAVDDMLARGWLQFDPDAPPVDITPYLTQAAGDSRYVRDVELDGQAAALLPAVQNSNLTAAIRALLAADTADSATAVGAALRAALAPRNGAAQGAEVQIDFTTKPDGALTVTDTAQQIRYVATSGQGALAVSGGYLTNTGTTGTSTGYSEVRLAANVNRIGGEFAFDTVTGTAVGNAITIVVWQASRVDTYPSVPAARCHFVVTPTTWSFGIWPSQGAGAQVVLATGGFSPALVADGATKYTVEIVIDGATAYLQLPDGRVTSVNDSRIASLAGPFACWEVYRPDAANGVRPKFSRAWASADPSPLVTALALPRVVKASGTNLPRTAFINSGNNTYTVTATSGATATEVASGFRIPFIVPASGKLTQRITAYLSMAGAVTYFWVPQVVDSAGASLRAPSVQVTASSVNDWRTIEYQHSGLTPFQPIELRWLHWATSTATVTSVRDDAGTGRGSIHVVTPLGT